ncbi:MAG: hypothetical protein ACI89X_003832 [Planctomycetota bacterium]|jgi:hypothetical protein
MRDALLVAREQQAVRYAKRLQAADPPDRAVSALNKALELERKLFGLKKSKRAKPLRKMHKAFGRAVKGWPAASAELVGKLAAGL